MRFMYMMEQSDKALVIALVRAHILTDPDNMSYVPPYKRVRWSYAKERCIVESAGGHLRRKAHCKRSLDCLACVCKQEELAVPKKNEPKPGRRH